MSHTVDELKDRVLDAVDARAATLLEVSHDIHGHPELAFDEHRAHDLLMSVLEGEGLAVDRGHLDVPTAFAASAGSDRGPLVAVLLEYDALPEIGHACGHNVIAAAGLGAGLAAASVVDALGGRLLVLGTPAEEGGGGKVFLAERGALDGVDAALMVHPSGLDLATMDAIAIQRLRVTYHGREAHAAAAPELGRNALDAAVLGYMNVAALRQHIRPDERVHGIFTEAGEAPNVVPQRTSALWYVRSPSLDGLDVLKDRVLACLHAGADAAGCTMEHEWVDPAYADMVDNVPLVDLYRANAARTGRDIPPLGEGGQVVGSTDMGNVSHLVPAIHPMIAVSPATIPIHTADFAGFAAGPEGDRAVLDAAKALASTVVDLWLRPDVLDEVRAAFDGRPSPTP